MPVGAPRFFLRPDEQVKIDDRIQARWIMRGFIVSLVPAAVVIGVSFAAARQVPGFGWLAWTVAIVIAASFVLLSTIAAWRRVATTEYVLTQETAYARRGRFLLRLEAVPLDKITDVTAATSVLGRVLGYSTLLLRTAGGAVHYVGIRDAFRMREGVEDQRTAFIRRLLRDADLDIEAAQLQRDSQAATCRCPKCALSFAVGTQRPLDVMCPRCGEEGTLFAPEDL